MPQDSLFFPIGRSEYGCGVKTQFSSLFLAANQITAEQNNWGNDVCIRWNYELPLYRHLLDVEPITYDEFTAEAFI